MNENERNERIVCEFLRKIAPPREWEYLGEVEHYWISQLCDELNKQLKAENAKLKRRLEILKDHGIEIADAVAGGFEIYNKEHARADRLQAENEKLESRLTIYMADAETWNAQWVAEHESNAKLQELCAALYRCADAGKPCETCPLYDGDGGCMDEQRMRELGIEVDA